MGVNMQHPQHPVPLADADDALSPIYGARSPGRPGRCDQALEKIHFAARNQQIVEFSRTS